MHLIYTEKTFRPFATRVPQLKIWHFLSYWYIKKRFHMRF